MNRVQTFAPGHFTSRPEPEHPMPRWLVLVLVVGAVVLVTAATFFVYKLVRGLPEDVTVA